MSWNRRAEWLEKQLEFERANHIVEIARLEKAHAETLSRVIEERDRLRDDFQRLQFAERPSLQQIVLPSKDQDNAPPPAPMTPMGSPWQRRQALWAIEQEQAAKTETEKALEAVAKARAAKGEKEHGSPS
jgi:hypothetical protein